MSGPYDTLDRFAQLLVALAALFALANGGFMLLSPLDWYYAVPTVRATGPANTHFIADIGIAYLACGVILVWALPSLKLRWLAALAGALWLTAHGVLHVYELAVGICSPSRFLADAPGVLGPPLLVLIAVGTLVARQRIGPAGLPKGLFLKIVDKLTPGESQYVHELARAPGRPLEKFMAFMPVSDHRHVTPAGLLSAARIGSVLVEDCGPCSLTAAHGGLRDGVPRNRLNAALAGGADLPPEEALAFRFGQAIAAQSPEADELGDAIEAEHGRTVRLELAMAAASVRVYPAMKRGLGLTKACSATRLMV